MTLLQIQTDWTINIGHIIWLLTLTGGLVGMYWNLRVRITKIEVEIKTQKETATACKQENDNNIKEIVRSISANYDKVDKKLNWTNDKIHDLHIKIVQDK